MPVASELLVKIGLEDDLTKPLAGASRQVEGFAKGASVLGGLATAAFAGIGVAAIGLGAGLGSAVKGAATFEAAISSVGALANANADQLRQLSEAALQLGQDTRLSGIDATDAAAAMEALAAAGFSVGDMTGGVTEGVLLLASATGTDVARAATIAGDAFGEFRKSMGLTAADMPRIANLFTGAANVSSIGLEDIGEAMKSVGPVAASMGISIDNVTAAIAELGNQGIKGGQAGTALRGILASLADPSKESAALIKQLGLNFRDAQGGMKDFGGISEELRTKLAGLTQAQREQAVTQLFGRENLAAILALMEGGQQTIDDYTKQIAAQGNAAVIGAKRNDNLAGSWQALLGVGQTLQIMIGQQLTPILKTWVDQATTVGQAAIPLVQAWGPRFTSAIQSGIGRAVAIVQSFGLAVLAMVNSLRTGNFSNLFGPLIVAISTAFGSETAGKVTLFVSKLVTGLNLARDAVLTAKQAFSGDWVSADSIATPVRLIGELFLGLGEAVRTVQGWIAQIPAPVLAAGAAFLALGPALSIVGAILPTIIGALTGLGPIISILTSSLPLLGTIIGALGGPITIAIVAIGLLAAAWATNFMGIRDSTMPVVNEIVAFFNGTLLPALTNLGTFISTTVVPAFVAGWAAVQTAVATAIAAIMPVVQQFSDWFTTNLLPALQNLIAIAVPAFQQMGAAALGAFQAALPGIQTFIAGVQQLASVVMPIITQVAGVIIDSLGPAIMAMVGWAQTVIPQFAAAFTTVMSIVGPVIGEIASVIGTGLGAIAGFISDHSAQITAILTDAWNIISGTIGVVFGVITGLISAGLQVISGDWSGAWETIKATASTAWDGIQQIVSSAIDLVKNYITVGLDAAKATAALAWDGIKIAATAAWDGIKTLVSSAIDGVKTLISDGLNAAKQTAQTALDAMATAATTAMDNLKTAISNGISSAKDTISTGVSGFADLVLGIGDAMYNAGASIIGMLAKGIDSAIGAAVQKVKDGLSQIANLLPHSEPKDPSSPLRGLTLAGASIFSMLADGIAQGTPEAVRAVQSGAGAIAQSLASTLGSLGTINDTNSDKSAAGIMRLFAANFAVALDTMKATAGAAGDFLTEAQSYKSMILLAVTAIKEAQAALNTVNFGGGGLTVPALHGAGDQAGQALGDGITKGIKKSLDIHSPSQVMAAIGRDVVAGLVQGMDAAQQDAAKKAADVASAIADAVSKGVAAFASLGSFVAPGAGNIAAFGQTVRLAVNDLAVLAAEVGPEMLAAAATFAEGAGKALGLYGSGLSGFAGLRDYVRPAASAIYDFGKDLRLALDDLALLAEQLTTDTSDLAGKFGEGVSKATGGIANAVAGFAALRDYARIPSDALYAFGKDLRLLVQDFAAIVDLIGVAMVEQAGKLGESVGKVTGGIAGAVAGFTALRGFVRVPAADIAAFADSLDDLLVRMVAIAATFEQQGLDAGSRLGEAVGKITGGLATAIGGFAGLSTFVTPGRAAVDGLLATITYVIARFGEMATTMSVEGVAQTTAFGTATSAVLGGVKAAIDTFIALDKAVVPQTGDLSDLVVAVQGVTRNMATAAAALGDDAIKDATAFGTAAQGIFTALKSGLDLFIQIDKPGGWPSTDWLQPLIELMGGVLSRGGQLLTQAQQLESVAAQFAASVGRAMAGFGSGWAMAAQGALPDGGNFTMGTPPVPLSGTGGGGGGTIVNNYYNTTVTGNTMLGDDYATAARLAAILEPELRRRLGLAS